MSMSTTDTTSTPAPLNREAWLHALAEKLSPIMKERANLTLNPGSYKLSVGFPSVRARAAKGGRIGECWHGDNRKTKEIFIHPRLGENPVGVAETVLHELIHAALPAGAGHKKPFSQAAKKLGLLPEGARPTATWADEEMKVTLKEICDEIGPFPHEALDTSRMPKQSTRLVKVMCPLCGHTIRDTRKWLDESGAPICATCDIQMEETEAGEGPKSPLVSVSATHEYKVPPIKTDPKDKTIYDPRWSIRMTRNGKSMTWYVIDYGEPFYTDEDGRKVAVLGAKAPRLTPALDREDALNILEALRDGLMTYTEIDSLLAERDQEAEYEDDYLAEDEEETPDYPEDQPTKDEEEAYEATKRAREGVSDPAGASDGGNLKRVREEREIGSFQYKWKV